MRLGIDFGTTRSLVAFCDRGNFPVVSFEGEEGDPLDWYPSVAAERRGELRFGFEALQAAEEPGWTILRSFKRILSDPELATDSQVQIGDTRLPVRDLLQGFLASLHRALLEASNLPRAGRGRLEAMVAVPAHAHSTQRFLTLDAFRQAGFEVLGLVNEPSAAGFEYTHRHRDTLTSRRDHVVIYDLGGGTFDVSLIHMAGARHDVEATAGAGRLGGDDFDAALARLAVPAFDRLSPARVSLLLERCRTAKESLHPNSRRLVLDLETILEDHPGDRVLPVSEFYAACEPLVERTLGVMAPIIARAESQEAQAGSDLEDIAGIYVVGGASALPLVGRALRQRYGRRVHRSPYPSAATAIGLAIAADEAAHLALSDRLSRTFGVFREAQGGAQVAFDPILPRDTPLPRHGEEPRTLRRTYRPVHNIGHFRYVECTDLDGEGTPTGDLALFAELRFPYDPALRGPDTDLAATPVKPSEVPLPAVEECYSVDANGILEVSIRDLDSGYTCTRRLG